MDDEVRVYSQGSIDDEGSRLREGQERFIEGLEYYDPICKAIPFLLSVPFSRQPLLTGLIALLNA